MNKAELISAVAGETGFTKKDTDSFIDAFIKIIGREFENGGSVQLSGFGIFYVGERASREGVNPGTGEKITIEASKCPKFRASKTLKESINKK